jgi:hypothetical protein
MNHSRVLDLVSVVNLEPSAETAKRGQQNAQQMHEIVWSQRKIVFAQRESVLQFNARTVANMGMETQADGASDEEADAWSAAMRLATEGIMSNFRAMLASLDTVGTGTRLQGAAAAARQTERDRAATSIASASAVARCGAIC